MPRILRVDPGLNNTGWGIIERTGNQLSFVACGAIKPQGNGLAERLLSLHQGLDDVLRDYSPFETAVEETFVNVNGASTLKLGQARGAILLTLSQANLPVYEYAATLVKKTVVGVGRAEKPQVAAMVQMLLPGCKKHGADAMDALAVAICHANHSNTREAITGKAARA